MEYAHFIKKLQLPPGFMLMFDGARRNVPAAAAAAY